MAWAPEMSTVGSGEMPPARAVDWCLELHLCAAADLPVRETRPCRSHFSIDQLTAEGGQVRSQGRQDHAEAAVEDADHADAGDRGRPAGRWDYTAEGTLDGVLAGQLAAGVTVSEPNATELVPPEKSDRDRKIRIRGAIRAA